MKHSFLCILIITLLVTVSYAQQNLQPLQNKKGQKIDSTKNHPPDFTHNGCSFQEYLTIYLNYPSTAILNNIEGLFDVNICVDRCGRTGEINISGENKKRFEHEIKRVINSAPFWKPARKNGIRTDSSVHVKIGFCKDKCDPPYMSDKIVLIQTYKVPLVVIPEEDITGYQQAEEMMLEIDDLIKQQKYNQAIANLNIAKEKKYFNMSDVYFYLGLSHYRINQIHTGCRYWLEGSRLNNEASEERYHDNCEFMTELKTGVHLMECECYEHAASHFEYALEMVPEDTSVLYYNALNNLKLGKRLKAYDYLLLAKERKSILAADAVNKYFTPNLLARDYTAKIRELTEKENYTAAIRYYDKIAELFPKQSFIYSKRAEIKFLADDNEGACKDLQKALELGDENSRELIIKRCE